MSKLITDINELDFSKRYTYADYLKWRFDERVELIKGWIHKMPASPSGRSPGPSRRHQKIDGDLFAMFWNFFRNKNTEVYNAPFDVKLLKNKGKSEKKQKPSFSQT